MSDNSGLMVRDLSVAYGQHLALDKVSMHIAPGEIVVILGANGAGKSTLLKSIAGLVPIRSGAIHMNQHPVNGMRPHTVVEAGLALVPEGRGIFGDLSVEENLRLGGHAKRARHLENENLDRVYSLFPKLVERRRQIARTMSGGEQQMVAIGRAMMSAPTILMLDEPSLGLSPLLCGELFKTLRKVRDTGLGILLVEQNARQSLSIADRGYLLETGRITHEDDAQVLMNDPAVQAAYLGGASASAAPVAATATAKPTPTPRTVTPPVVSEAPRKVFATGGFGSRSISSSALLGRDVGELIRSAEARSRDALRPPPSRSGTPSPTMHDTDDEVARLLRDLERAARDAARPRPGPIRAATETRVAGDATPSIPEADAPLPEIEIYRRPTIEIYRRERDAESGKSELKLIKRKKA